MIHNNPRHQSCILGYLSHHHKTHHQSKKHLSNLEFKISTAFILHQKSNSAGLQNSRCLFLGTSQVTGLYFSYLRSWLKSLSCICKLVCLFQLKEQQQQLNRVLYSDLGGFWMYLSYLRSQLKSDWIRQGVLEVVEKLLIKTFLINQLSLAIFGLQGVFLASNSLQTLRGQN